MTISPLDLLLLFGTLQGFILAALLWFGKKGNPLSNRLLAVLIGLFGLACLAVGMPITNWQINLFLDLVPLIMVMPMGPLIYFYIRSMLDADFKLGKQERRHFWPVLLDWGGKLIGWVFLAGILLGVFDHKDNQQVGYLMDDYDTYADIPRWLSVTAYLLLTHRWLKQFQQTTPRLELHRTTLRWIREFLLVFVGFQIIWLLHLIPYIIPATRNGLLDLFGWYPLYIPISIMIYWLGLRGYLHAQSQTVEPVMRKTSALTLPSEVIDRAASQLQQAMTTDKLYLDPELTVDKVGRHVNLPAKTVSAVLNQHLGKSFNSFVNEHRVDEVKRRLGDTTQTHLTLTGIAFDCGFNSQATFQRTFKQLTGYTPTEYLNQQAAC